METTRMSRGNQMNRQEILELMQLRGWSQAELARQLELSEAAVSRWFSGIHAPTGPARILLRMWLDKARKRQPTGGAA
jgi:DNA-binding transcriptional regulator YiaG